MKKLCFVLPLLLTIFYGCEKHCSTNSEQTKLSAIEEMQKFNDSLAMVNHSRGIGWTCFKKSCLIAGADFAGFGAGVAATKEIALLAAIPTGGTGGVAVASFCGLICAIGASSEAFDHCYPPTRSVHDIYTPTMIAKAHIYNQNYQEAAKTRNSGGTDTDYSDDDEDGGTETEIAYTHLSELVNIPEEYEYVRDFGLYHNDCLATLEDVEQGLVSLDDVELNEDLQTIIQSEEYQQSYDNIILATVSATTIDGLNIDQYVAVDGIYLTGKAVRVYELFLDVYNSYTDEDADIIELINRYINIIENSDEFTSDEKEAIYASFMIAADSPQYWQPYINEE